MTLKRLLDTLTKGEVATLKANAWAKLEGEFKLEKSHPTGVAGQLRIGVISGTRVAVEEACGGIISVRALSSQKKAAAFVKERLAAYDRLWDG